MERATARKRVSARLSPWQRSGSGVSCEQTATARCRRTTGFVQGDSFGAIPHLVLVSTSEARYLSRDSTHRGCDIGAKGRERCPNSHSNDSHQNCVFQGGDGAVVAQVADETFCAACDCGHVCFLLFGSELMSTNTFLGQIFFSIDLANLFLLLPPLHKIKHCIAGSLTT